MNKKVPLEKKIDELISESIETDGKKNNEKKIETLINKSKEVDKKISPLLRNFRNNLILTGAKLCVLALKKLTLLTMWKDTRALYGETELPIRSIATKLISELIEE